LLVNPKTFKSASDDVLLALASLGKQEGLPSMEITAALEECLQNLQSANNAQEDI